MIEKYMYEYVICMLMWKCIYFLYVPIDLGTTKMALCTLHKTSDAPKCPCEPLMVHKASG